jgi:plastocyanin
MFVAALSTRKARIYGAGLLAVGMLSALVMLAAPTASAANQTISIQHVQYNPNQLTIAVGDTVTWVNNETDGTVHSSTSDDGLWNSPDLGPGATFSFTFTQAGTFSFHCRFHPSMTGTITVTGGGGGGGGPTTTSPPPSSTTTTPTATTSPTTSSTSTTTTAPTSTGTSTTGTTAPTTTSGSPTSTTSPTESCIVPLPGLNPLPSCLIAPPLCVPLLGSIMPTDTAVILPTCIPPLPIDLNLAGG